MKECGSLQIVTESIRTFLSDVFQKNVNEILISDLLLVESLTINGKDFDGKKSVISFQDLRNFKNLKYLEVVNTYINSSVINIFSGLPYLENLIFKDCSFSKKIKNMGKLTQIKTLRIVDCQFFNPFFLEDLVFIKKIYLSGVILDDFQAFQHLDLDFLDVSCCFFKTVFGIDDLKVKCLIVGNSQYSRFRKKFSSLKIKIIVMADYREGYYIKKWIN